MKAIIMAGGKGTRLRPLTCNIPKPMMPILEKPVMEYTIELLKKHNIMDIGVTLAYLPDKIISYFGDGKNFGVNLMYFLEDKPLGTAGSVKNAEKFLDDTFIVISGDALTDIDISQAIKYHESKKSIATLVLKEVSVPLDYGVVVTEKDGMIKGFLEKPSWSEVFSDKVNTGIYVLDPMIFSFYEKEQKFDFSNDLFPILLKESLPMYAYVAEGYWCDIGNIQQYFKSQVDVLKKIVKVNVKGTEIKEGVWLGKNCEIHESSKIVAPVYIGANTKIYENTEIGPYCSIGRNNIISRGSTIKRSVILDYSYIGDNVEVRGAVLCKNVQLESRASVFEDAAIGDETIIGSRTIIKPGVKIWPNKVIEASTVVKTNVIWAGNVSNSLFGKKGISGEINVDITPELVSKIGSAYGAILKNNARVAISCSDDGAAQMFKYSLATGLLSLGIEVYDFKRMTLAMTRFATLFFGVNGAIHVAVDREEPQNVNIFFIDKNGVNIDKTQEREIENNFYREDFRRIKYDDFKQITHISDTSEIYYRSIINRLSVKEIRKNRFKIVLSTRNHLLNATVQKILFELKVNVKIYDNYKDLVGMSKEIKSSGADLGVILSDESESAIIIDEKGNIIKEDLYEGLKNFIMLKSSNLHYLVVPVTSSRIMESIATMCSVEFIRTKTSHKSILKVYLNKEDEISRREIIDSYLISLDALSVLSLTLNFMAESNIKLSSIVEKFPLYYKNKKDILCPWNMKGKVMRNLIEENPSKSIELIEGVRLNYEEAWALVLPDSDEPFCRLFAEANNYKEAERISIELSKRIEDLVSADIEI
ncbi:sugar phosphate nucleotidyltransferase [Clostridium grantii]|uniref:Mannose-1-phosphate guanylyltransferase / phosphomannomutase n=1 Tax=Clostridium grantii DSM 8605 TaxID=1121316 RepID=A0A1M5ULQ8_9CLOT|nr:sugar phosphate nucleotidyltransferase [Clostridium grantii]SHH63806.1 mannose-1-phosphate guanylyltransferase / phosphomannomutase [Clostridium grantii DSM 8605]